MPDQIPNLKSIFDAAFEIADPARRKAYLDSVCADQPDLRRRVEELLSAHERAGSFLETPAPQPSSTAVYVSQADSLPEVSRTITENPESGRAQSLPRTSDDQLGSWIGPYKLVERIGQGGMGSVFLAEQEEPVRRRVALKIIKAGMDSDQIIARFGAERQALAMMDHLNIAKVLDAGATATGRPYFVMELVEGVSLTRFCDDNRLTPRERLELFIPVCQAIQHAHQKGIIHRDIKPSNVLVKKYDGQAVPKVIDFGIAKAIEQPLLEPDLATQLGTFVGTLEYMSPEQADLGSQDIDTRTDVYSLGVMLYEMLTGATPLDRTRFRGKPLSEILRVIKEEVTPRPSDRLTKSPESATTLAEHCRTEPIKLARMLRGELDWIVLKALEKDRTRRYDSALDFAKDIQRYLSDEPVEACPPSAAYRFRKFARRNRTWLATAAGFVAMLVLGIVGLTIGVVKLNRANAEVSNSLAKVSKSERQTRSALDASDAAIRAMIRSRVSVGDSEKSALRVVLKNYKSRAVEPAESEDSRAMIAAHHARIADFHLLIVELPEAKAEYSRALQQYEDLHANFPKNAAYRQEIANIHFNLGLLASAQGNPEEAIKSYRRAIQGQQELADSHPTESSHQRDLADTWNNLATVYRDLGRLKESEDAIRQSISLGEKSIRNRSEDREEMISLAGSYSNRGNVKRDLGQVKESLADYDKAIKMLEPFTTTENPIARARLYLRNSYWDRAHAQCLLGKLDDGVHDWQRAREFDDGTESYSLEQFERGVSSELLFAKVRRDNPKAALIPETVAVAFSYCRAAAAPAAARLDPPLQNYFASRAMAFLDLAKQAGAFKTRKSLDLFEEPGLSVLRNRPDFQKLVAEVKKLAQ